MRISDWSSDVCSSDLLLRDDGGRARQCRQDNCRAARRDALSGAARNQAAEQSARRSRDEGRRMMFESLIRHPMRLLIGLVVLIVLLSQTLTIVPEDKQALVLRFRSEEHTSELQSIMSI